VADGVGEGDDEVGDDAQDGQSQEEFDEGEAFLVFSDQPGHFFLQKLGIRAGTGNMVGWGHEITQGWRSAHYILCRHFRPKVEFAIHCFLPPSAICPLSDAALPD